MSGATTNALAPDVSIPDEPLRANRDFATLLVSQSVSAGGDAVSATALPLLVLALTGSGVAMGTVSAINAAADFVMGTVAGAVADRGDRKRMMFLADVGRAILTAFIPISVLVHGPTMAVIVVVTAPLAILRGFFRAGYLAAMPNLVGRSQLARGNGVLESAFSSAFILGPAVAGFLVSAIGPGQTLAVDAASFLVSSLGLFLIRRELKAPSDRPPTRIVDDIREGVEFVIRHPVLRTVILVFALTSAGLSSISAAMTFRLVRDLGQSPAAFGLTLTGLGVGTLVGALAAARLGHRSEIRRVILACVFLMGAPIAAMAAIPSLPAIIALTAVAGAAEGALVVVYVSVRAANSPDQLVGRIASTARVISLGLMPIGSLIGGVLIDTVGGTLTLAILGGELCLLAAVFSRVGGLRAASLSASARHRPAVEPVLPISDGPEL